MPKDSKPKGTSNQMDELLVTLESRFAKNAVRHKGIEWDKVQNRLLAHPEQFWSLSEMERTGGEPDVIGHDPKSDEYIFCDCSPESPAGRRSICYDKAVWEARKEFKPNNNAVDMAASMGIELLTEEEYHNLQQLGTFDLKTSSWLKTPLEIRKLDGAIFGDRRFGRVFVYHNGVQSYYGARGFRGLIRI